MKISIRADALKLFFKFSAYFFEPLIFPSRCLKCGVYLKPEPGRGHMIGHLFCTSCFGTGVTRIEPPFCTICGTLFDSRSGGNHVCESCIRFPHFLGKIRGCVVYDGIIREAIPLFKYRAKLSLLSAFGPLMAQGFTRYFNDTGINLVMPVPLHKKKLRQRGFNQSYLLIRNLYKHIASKAGHTPPWKVDISSLERVEKTAPQTGFDIKERKKNLNNAFSVIHPDKIKNKHILLIDDVFTTGATCNEAAKTLLKAGATRVDALVLART